MTLLSVSGLHAAYGPIRALSGVDLTVAEGEIVALIGANGAGKSTLLMTICGNPRATEGRVLFAGQDITRLATHEIARLGIAQVPEGRRIFPRMTVLENLLVAQHRRLMRASRFSVAGLLGLATYARAEREAIAVARGWLERTDLVALADREAGTLPYGAQRRLEIARAMCTQPSLLCLDEPAAGLNPRESAALNRLLDDIRRQHDLGILLIEHDMNVVMGISDRIVVLDHGRKIAEGAPEAIRNDPDVIRAYLGEPESAELPRDVAADLRGGPSQEIPPS
jgi:branched-chain amino acid transport system ATP-binding protein